MKFLVLILPLVAGCGELASTTYRGQVGRSVGEVFTRGTTTWQAGVELKFDARRP